MRIKIEFKDMTEPDERFGTYDTDYNVNLNDLLRTVNANAFIKVTWRKPTGERTYADTPVLLATDTIATIVEASDGRK
jgi:hypothetical protein